MPECDLKNETCGFRCTGFEGGEIWKEIHAIPKKIECESCAEHTTSIFNGVHDMVNAGLGKKAFDKSNFNKFADEVECVRARCQEEGRC